MVDWMTNPQDIKQPPGWGTPDDEWDFTPEMANYIDKLKIYENDMQIGYDPKTKTWKPHESLEGGTKTVGYGHKLGLYDDPNELYSETEVDSMLVLDVFNAYRSVFRRMKNSKHDWNSLSSEDKVILTELMYNTGNSRLLEKAIEYLGAGEDKKDYVSLKELIGSRGYRDKEGTFHPLKERNEDIIQSYIRR